MPNNFVAIKNKAGQSIEVPDWMAQQLDPESQDQIVTDAYDAQANGQDPMAVIKGDPDFYNRYNIKRPQSTQQPIQQPQQSNLQDLAHQMGVFGLGQASEAANAMQNPANAAGKDLGAAGVAVRSFPGVQEATAGARSLTEPRSYNDIVDEQRRALAAKVAESPQNKLAHFFGGTVAPVGVSMLAAPAVEGASVVSGMMRNAPVNAALGFLEPPQPGEGSGFIKRLSNAALSTGIGGALEGAFGGAVSAKRALFNRGDRFVKPFLDNPTLKREAEQGINLASEGATPLNTSSGLRDEAGMIYKQGGENAQKIGDVARDDANFLNAHKENINYDYGKTLRDINLKEGDIADLGDTIDQIRLTNPELANQITNPLIKQHIAYVKSGGTGQKPDRPLTLNDWNDIKTIVDDAKQSSGKGVAKSAITDYWLPHQEDIMSGNPELGNLDARWGELAKKNAAQPSITDNGVTFPGASPESLPVKDNQEMIDTAVNATRAGTGSSAVATGVGNLAEKLTKRKIPEESKQLIIDAISSNDKADAFLSSLKALSEKEQREAVSNLRKLTDTSKVIIPRTIATYMADYENRKNQSLSDILP